MFGDESADETKCRVFVVAGVVGSEPAWEEAEKVWLHRTGGKPFHANVCESEFARHEDQQKHKDNLLLIKDLTCILVDSSLVGLSVALDLQAFADLFPAVLPDLAYYKCFLDVVSYAAQMARRANASPEEPDSMRLEFTFDSRMQSDGTAGHIYTVLRTQPEWADTSIFDTKIVFEGGPNARLEMADLVAREGMKELDRRTTKARPSARRSWQALDGAYHDAVKRFIFENHDREYCRRWRSEVERPETKAMMDAYAQWLIATHRVQDGRPHDTTTNRFLFHAWQQKQRPSA